LRSRSGHEAAPVTVSGVGEYPDQEVVR
jgi:hypothetical protein